MKKSVLMTVALISICATCAGALAGDLTVTGQIESKAGFRFPDGSIQTSAAGTGYENTIVVAKSGGDFTSVTAALGSIADASPANRYLVWVAPGVYYEKVSLKPYVSLMGASREATTISQVGIHGGTVVTSGDESEISSLTIYCGTDADSPCTGLEVVDASNGALVRDVAVNVRADAGGKTVAVAALSSTTVTNLELRNSRVSAQGGADNIGIHVASETSYVNVLDSEVVAGAPSIADHESRAVQIEGGRLTADGSRIRGSGGATSRGLWVRNGTALLRHTEISSRATMQGSVSIGIESRLDSTLEAAGSSVLVSGANTQYGILTQETGGTEMTIELTHSKIQAEDFTVLNPSSYSDARFLFTHFDGGPALGANNTCLFATDEALATYESDCP